MGFTAPEVTLAALVSLALPLFVVTMASQNLPGVAAIRAAGYTDLLAQFVGDSAYSYVFAGQSGYLDHALASASLLRNSAARFRLSVIW